MATVKRRSKGRFINLFDWNAKSRKKLFSTKSESSEGSTQGKENVDNLVISQYLLRELRENGEHSSFRGSGYYSCASSVDGDDGYGTKAPGVVARLMGLDSLPTMAPCEAASVSSYDSHGVTDSYYPRGAAPRPHDRQIPNYNYAPSKVECITWSSVDLRNSKFHGRPIERFQTEILPPKSAKPISITHHKLLSPIKSPGFVPTNDAASIMEAAARIIDSSPHSHGRAKISSLGSPSSSFRIQDLRDRMDAAQRSSKLPDSKTPKHTAAPQQLRGNSSDRRSNRSLFKNIIGLETITSQREKNKGKSDSSSRHDKSDVQKKEGPSCSGDRSLTRKEQKPSKLKQKQSTPQKVGQNRTSRSKSSGVLRPNNDKQNSVSCKDKSTTKASISDQLPRKVAPADNSAGPSKIVNKVFVNTENRPKKVATTTSAGDKRTPLDGIGEKRPSLNKMKNISRNKQFSARDKQSSENVSRQSDERVVQSDPPVPGNSRKDLDVISFTFTSPIKKSSSQSLSSMEDAERNHHLSVAGPCDSNGHAGSSSSRSLGLNLIDSGSLSILLEQKLKELTEKIVTSKSESISEGPDADSISCFSESISSHDVGVSSLMEYDEWSDKDQTNAVCDEDCSLSLGAKLGQKLEDVEGHKERGVRDADKCEPFSESYLPQLNISVPECSISGSCMSSNATSDFTYGHDQPPSPHSQEAISCVSTESVHPRDDETDCTDALSYWELEYARHVLHYAGLNRYRLDQGSEIIDPGIFDLLENLINTSGRNAELCSKLDRKILFGCVTEIVSSMYGRVFVGSQRAWAKWGMLLQNEWITEEVFKEILCLQSMGSLMVDELVDRDMSTEYGRWLDFEIESLEEGSVIEEEIVSSLVDELVAELSI